MTALQSEKSKYYKGKSVEEHAKNRQKRLPCGISKTAIVENLNSWGGGGEEGFQHALDNDFIIPLDQESVGEPRYIVNPEKFPDPDSTTYNTRQPSYPCRPAALRHKGPKYYMGKAIVEYVHSKQKRLPGGISRSIIVENLISWGGGGEGAFQYALDHGLIIPSGQNYMLEPGYIVNPEKFSDTD